MTEFSKTVLTNPIHFVAFGFGAGLAPKAPGTFGTVVAIPFYLLLVHTNLWIYAGVIVLSFLFGVWLCGKSAEALGIHDHGGIVWDEIVGYWITMFLAPAGWPWILLGFGLFRLLDILKPWPIKLIDQRVEGGLGIMLDDVLAGIMAALCIQALAVLFA
ncbi:MAG: phosphatidylglycerophosphatase A [Pseudomonadales bacterium]|nr:phosphatidylglycerophosphatase A [Pseudomonadales bacterium]